jgi:hypothetical protein
MRVTVSNLDAACDGQRRRMTDIHVWLYTLLQSASMLLEGNRIRYIVLYKGLQVITVQGLTRNEAEHSTYLIDLTNFLQSRLRIFYSPLRPVCSLTLLLLLRWRWWHILRTSFGAFVSLTACSILSTVLLCFFGGGGGAALVRLSPVLG